MALLVSSVDAITNIESWHFNHDDDEDDHDGHDDDDVIRHQLIFLSGLVQFKSVFSWKELKNAIL